MAKTKIWNFFKADGTPVNVTLNKNRFVSVNGGPEMKLNTLKAPEGSFAEKVFNVPVGNGEYAKLCVKNNQVLTYNGFNVETGEAYTPMELPKWAYVFVVLYVMNFFLVIGGAIGGAISAGFAFLTATIASDRKMSTGLRVFLCILLYIGVTIGSLFIAIVLLGVFNAF
ncbi:MAG: hypothetical protein K6E79_03640 [Pseudobutyrivibrio sp.]|nr:hypothetical protein [Pseudobutyrivibrio sp.]